MAAGFIEEWKPENNLLWVANGLLLAYLLLAPRWRWPAYLLHRLSGSFRSLCCFVHQRWSEFLLYNLLDIVEVITARPAVAPAFHPASALHRTPLPHPFLRLCGSGWTGAGGNHLCADAPSSGAIAAPPNAFLRWMAADSLGIAIATPAFAAVFQTPFRSIVNWRRDWFYPALLLGSPSPLSRRTRCRWFTSSIRCWF